MVYERLEPKSSLNAPNVCNYLGYHYSFVLVLKWLKSQEGGVELAS